MLYLFCYGWWGGGKNLFGLNFCIFCYINKRMRNLIGLIIIIIMKEILEFSNIKFFGDFNKEFLV